MTLSALLLSTLAFDAAPAPSFDTTKLQGTGGIVIIREKKKEEQQLNGTGGIVIVREKKKEN
ncbi:MULTISPECIES: hypothetical protein [unclassified Pseudoalteromonas]|uniref:hypothetical protein n=1 Tax=unclassified Pseudoalteromonas TaxID=194690 RepID=UPI0018F55FBE|nr:MULTISPECIES: hypothetical protein [unclassified Pseudoalteromonas]MCF2915053.1 hypothetical protein [Pseudoalteromonas sp. Cn5-37]URQ85007.1 hypothetical protein J8Z28_10340 [Pseudoalteromonas sp. SCSIO 43088]GKW51505.1 hypothetical protein NCCP2140_05580 [Pseudoalteromonas sp. NCCP-2140]|tara:strand:- start:23 stop:208 length:186 start_codon:yes stop_codon:yes gene_type:complete